MKKTLSLNYKGYTIDRIYNEHNESLNTGAQRSISDYPYTVEQRLNQICAEQDYLPVS